MQRVRRKVTINFTTSPTIAEGMDSSIEEYDYAGRSDYISIAISEKLIKEELEMVDKSIDLFLAHVISDSFAKQRILELIPKNTAHKISALKKKAKACIELGEFDEAEKCLNIAKELSNKTGENPVAKNKIKHIEEKRIEEEGAEF